jgi:hypothetical protein
LFSAAPCPWQLRPYYSASRSSLFRLRFQILPSAKLIFSASVTYGPYISTIRFLTPYAQVVSLSGNKSAGYSAQQAERDHHADAETVTVSVDIYLTDSYGPFLAAPTNSRSGSPAGLTPRSSDFWRDFDVSVSSDSRTLSQQDTSGQPIYNCSESGCSLVGATVTLTFAASKFPPDSVTVNVVPPEGDEVNVDFDLTSFR